MMKVHNHAPVFLTHAVLPNMIKKNRGIIINTSSVNTWLPTRNGIYSSTKSFLTMFSRSLHHDLLKSNIRIQALCPGFFDSEIHDKKMKQQIPKILFKSARYVAKSSLKGVENNKPVVIPGFIYKIAKWLFTNTFLRKPIIRFILKQQPY